MKSKRFEVLAARPVNQDGYVQEWPEVGLIAMNSPFDPKPSIKIENGVITEMDGKCRADFDMLDTFIADHAIRLGNAEKAMAMDSLEIARKIVDINVSREEILDITLSLTPAKLTEVVGKLNIVEIMMGMTKMRARMMPANQCHVTNVRDNPVQIAADAAEAGVRGFAEMETTVAVARYAPFNAMALFVGAQVGRPGVMTQCALEEATELQLGMRGFTTYAETISVYGTEPVFMDGDDTPYSKAFLASCYASRGLKMRFTSGTGSEVTSFSVITDKQNGNIKYPLADYRLTPDVAIIDPQFTRSMPKSIVADTGLDVLTHAIEAYVSVMASDYTDGLALHAIEMVFTYLEKSYNGDPLAREKMHNASCIAGMAFTNAFLGLNHSMAHKLGAECHIPHGRANAILLPYVIQYNATKPTKFASFPKYKEYVADERYAKIARRVGLCSADTPISEAVDCLVKAIRELMTVTERPLCIKDCGVSEAEFMSKVDELSYKAFEDQCTTANPVYPLVSEIKELYREAYYGE